ncbi:MAG: hypothetical protein LBF40_08020, partial [Deltaproteobacteria bacterium]|nr:hypothetical protein [Deltaproteobacteria bacterium]
RSGNHYASTLSKPIVKPSHPGPKCGPPPLPRAKGGGPLFLSNAKFERGGLLCYIFAHGKIDPKTLTFAIIAGESKQIVFFAKIP